MTLAEWLQKYQHNLQRLYEKEEVNAVFTVVVNELLNYNASALLLHKHEPIGADISLKFNTILNELTSSKPIQYILGSAFFYGLKFTVNASVLIPRPETEELVEWVISSQKSTIPSLRILDVGTGSGCIAISLQKNLPKARVIAVDISEAAIATATENASVNEVEVQFMVCDILAPSEELKQERFDIIVSNPPYVKEDEKPAMHQNVLANEPHTALFVSNGNPLLFYNAIADFALTNLNTNGWLFLEINEYLGDETVTMLTGKGFRDIVLRQDMQGKDRMILARLL